MGGHPSVTPAKAGMTEWIRLIRRERSPVAVSQTEVDLRQIDHVAEGVEIFIEYPRTGP